MNENDEEKFWEQFGGHSDISVRLQILEIPVLYEPMGIRRYPLHTMKRGGLIPLNLL
jgi:hypothetical protein